MRITSLPSTTATAAFLWVTQAVGSRGASEVSIATTNRGDSYVTGYFSGTVTFGQGEPNQTTLTSAGFSDVFVAGLSVISIIGLAV